MRYLNTDKATNWLGFLGSVVSLLHSQAIIDDKLSSLIFSILSLLFGYLTNKSKIKLEEKK